MAQRRALAPSGGPHTAICAEANKPFWLQLVGTGITTTWAAHLGAVLDQARWPAITCMNIWESQLLAEPIEIRGGFYRVPEAPGLGSEIDSEAVESYRVDYTWVDPPRHIYRYRRANGEVTYYGCSKQELHRIYPQDAQPICEAGSILEPVPDDGSPEFAQLYAAVQEAASCAGVSRQGSVEPAAVYGVMATAVAMRRWSDCSRHCATTGTLKLRRISAAAYPYAKPSRQESDRAHLPPAYDRHRGSMFGCISSWRQLAPIPGIAQPLVLYCARLRAIPGMDASHVKKTPT